MQSQLTNRFGPQIRERIDVKNIRIPDMSDVQQQLGRYENFSLFIPKHRRLAGKLIQIFVGKLFIQLRMHFKNELPRPIKI